MTPMRAANLFLVLAVSSPLVAQTPGSRGVSTPPAAAKSARKAGGGSDTLYKLAVKPSDHPDESVVWLLDEGVLRLEPDGRGTRTYRQVVQVLNEDAVERYREQEFSYSPGHEKMTVNWIRVVEPDGRVISTEPSHIQDSDVPADRGDPVYSDRKVRRASLTGVEPGAIVDYSYTTEELKPYLPGDFLESWAVNTATRTMRSNYVIDVPESFNIRIKEKNPHFPRRTTTANGRRIFTWSAADLTPEKLEAFASIDSSTVFQSIRVGGNLSWATIGKWYADNARDRYAITPAVAAKIAGIVAGARTREDSIRAIHRWVAQDIRYVSIALGMGSYQPRAPETVVETGFGDCKDKVTLFVAALGKIGVTAFPVLLNSDGNADRDLPSIGQFDHAIAAVPQQSGYVYTDLTAALVPYGVIPPSEQDGFALVVHPDGRSEEVVLPLDSVGANSERLEVTGVLDEAGMFNGRYNETASGAATEMIRSVFENPLDSAQRANMPKQLAHRLFEVADADSLEIYNGKDLAATPALSFRIRNARAAVDAGGTRILTIPLGSMGQMTTMAASLEKEPKRRFPIDASKVFGPHSSVTTLTITLPPGWKAKLPPGISATSAFGSYASEYTQTGNVLRLSRKISGTRAVLPPERMPDLIAWLRQVGKDDARFIVLERAPDSHT
jgi:transglutaminase-like putative cysteine protease